MNTIRSVWYGWATLIIAAGSAYYLAKKDINKDRAERAAAELQKRKLSMMLEYGGSQALEDEARILRTLSSSSSSPSISSTSQSQSSPSSSSITKNKTVKSTISSSAPPKKVSSDFRNSKKTADNDDDDDTGTVTRWAGVANTPSREAGGNDPAPTGHAMADAGRRGGKVEQKREVEAGAKAAGWKDSERGQFEAYEPYRSRRGDRFS